MCVSEKVLQQDETADEAPEKPICWGLKMGGGGGGGGGMSKKEKKADEEADEWQRGQIRKKAKD